MRRIYVPIAIGICLLFMWLGSMMGSHVPAETKAALKKAKADMRVLEGQRNESDHRALFWEMEALSAKARVEELEAELPKHNERISAITKDNEKKIAAVQKYTVAQRDSFFYAKYPGQDVIKDVDSKKVMADLVGAEGLDTLNRALSAKIVHLEEIVFTKDTVIYAQEQQLTEAQFKTTILHKELSKSKDIADIWKADAKKYKRQRDLVIVGVGLGVAGTIYLLAH